MKQTVTMLSRVEIVQISNNSFFGFLFGSFIFHLSTVHPTLSGIKMNGKKATKAICFRLFKRKLKKDFHKAISYLANALRPTIELEGLTMAIS